MAEFPVLWWVFPTSIVFATVAVGSGVSGALFFSPFFMIVVGLSPAQAVGAGLLTEARPESCVRSSAPASWVWRASCSFSGRPSGASRGRRPVA